MLVICNHKTYSHTHCTNILLFVPFYRETKNYVQNEFQLQQMNNNYTNNEDTTHTNTHIHKHSPTHTRIYINILYIYVLKGDNTPFFTNY